MTKIDVSKIVGVKSDIKPIDKKMFWQFFREGFNEVSGIKPEYYDNYTKSAFKFTENNKVIVQTVLRYFCGDPKFNECGIIKNNPCLDKGVLIYGDLGVGKSILFQAIYEAGRKVFRSTMNSRATFTKISCGSFVNTYMMSTKHKNMSFDINYFYKGGLYIDDLGVEPLAFNSYELMEQVLFERYRNKATTFVTTNLKPSEISQRYGSRIGDRLPEMFNIIKWSGESFRPEM